MAEDPYNKLFIQELQKIGGRLSCIEDRLKLIEGRVNRTFHSRRHFIARIKCLQVEKQSLTNYIRELEKFNNLPQ